MAWRTRGARVPPLWGVVGVVLVLLVADMLWTWSLSPRARLSATMMVPVSRGEGVRVRASPAQRTPAPGASWPPVDTPTPLPASAHACNMRGNLTLSEDDSSAHRIVRFRHGHLKSWYQPGCKQWKLDGEYRRRPDRRVYYGFAFGGEMEVLTVVLEEIYDVVDVIIILEGRVTWRGDAKPLFFEPRSKTHFAKYMDKIRYIPYAFDDDVVGARVKDCLHKDPAGVYGPGEFNCRWLRQWGARDYIALEGAKDIGPNDVFVITDLDELLSREFLRAVKHCDVWPEPKHPDKCSRVGIHVFGHRHHFGCTIAKHYGHFHPDMVLGRCLSKYGGEEVRRDFGERKRYQPKPPGLLKAKYVGPGGWHMHSFLSTAQTAWKWFSRSGRAQRSWTVADLERVKRQRELCDDGPGFMTMDARACEPIPHLVRENPQAWAHFLGYVDDEELRDEFDVEPHYREALLKRRDPNDRADLRW